MPQSPELSGYGRSWRTAALGLVLSLALAGCATLRPPEPITVAQVVEMCQAGQPPDVVIRALRANGAVYELSAAQIVTLHGQGVPNEVLDYMAETRVRAARQDEAARARRDALDDSLLWPMWYPRWYGRY